MKDLLLQIDTALDANLYYLAMFGALAIPDICAAMQAESGQTTSRRYKNWFNRYVADRYVVRGESLLSGEDCYRLRCSLLHQGTAYYKKGTYAQYILVESEATTNWVHLNRFKLPTGTVLNLDVRTFCRDILSGAYAWLEEYESTDVFRENFDRFMQRRPDGIVNINGIPFAPFSKLPIIA